ncbi:MAG: hypothetical protein ACP6KW_04075 [Candidatus Thorarchaeota archaeon]
MAKIDLVKRPYLHSPRHLLRYVFFTEMQVEQAAKILNAIMDNDNKIPDSEWEDKFLLSSRGLYVKVMRKLRDVGLVEKELGNYKLSKAFADALSKIATKWYELLQGYQEGDRDIRF